MNLFKRMIHGTDAELTSLLDLLTHDASRTHRSNEFQLKKGIHYESIEAGQKTIQLFKKAADDEQKKFFVKKFE